VASTPNAVTINTCAELATLLGNAKTPGSIRVRGAMHSVRESILPDGGPTPTTVTLGSEFLTTRFDTQNFPVASIGGGVRLGGDPDQGVPASVGMLNWLATASPLPGWSVPDLGGITHQSVGGFLSTGSSGGSLSASLHDAIVGVGSVCSLAGSRDDRRFGRSALSEACRSLARPRQITTTAIRQAYGRPALQPPE